MRVLGIGGSKSLRSQAWKRGRLALEHIEPPRSQKRHNESGLCWGTAQAALTIEEVRERYQMWRLLRLHHYSSTGMIIFEKRFGCVVR